VAYDSDYGFDAQGWEDWEGNVHWGVPTDVNPEDIHGLFAHYYTTDGEEHYHWVYIDGPFDNWEDWFDLVDGISEDHSG